MGGTRGTVLGALGLGALLLGGACATGTGPGPVQEEYALVRVGEQALPARFGLETWLADTIRFHEGGGWSRVEVVRLHAEGASPEPVRRTSEGTVSYQGEVIVLDFTCNDTILASCVAPDSVRVEGDGLVRRANRYDAYIIGFPPLFRYEAVSR